MYSLPWYTLLCNALLIGLDCGMPSYYLWDTLLLGCLPIGHYHNSLSHFTLSSAPQSVTEHTSATTKPHYFADLRQKKKTWRARIQHPGDTSNPNHNKSINMADENNTNNPRDWGHHKSPIFKLPPEIRNKIYAETFEGSEISLVIDPPPTVAVVPVTGRHSVFNTDNSNHHILLTCRLAYLEALALYWTTVIVRNGCGGHFSRAYFLNRM